MVYIALIYLKISQVIACGARYMIWPASGNQFVRILFILIYITLDVSRLPSNVTKPDRLLFSTCRASIKKKYKDKYKDNRYKDKMRV